MASAAGADTTRQPLSQGGPRRLSMLLSRPGRRGYWALAILVLVVGGLGLRLVAADSAPLGLDRWLPWLNPPAVTLHFPDTDGRFLVPVTRRVSSKSVNAEGAVRELLEGPRDGARLAAALPRDGVLDGVEVVDGRATVSINAPGEQSLDPDAAQLAADALLRTLEPFDDIRSVRLLVDGASVADAETSLARRDLHPIYYSYGPYLVPVAEASRAPDEALRAYLSGVGADPGLVGLPSDVRLIGYRLDAGRGLAYISFTFTESLRDFAVGDPDGVRRALTGIVAMLTSYPEVTAVMLDFEGRARLGLGQCSDMLRAPQLEPGALNGEAAAMRR